MDTQLLDAIAHAKKHISPKAYPIHHIHDDRWIYGFDGHPFLFVATITLENLCFDLAITWQQTVDGGQIARWRRGDLMATLIFQGKRLTVVFSSATDHSIPAFVPEGATDVAKALTDAGVLLMAKPEGVLL